MQKKRRITILVFIVGLILVLFFLLIRPQTVIQNGLSQRGEELLGRSESLKDANLTPVEKKLNEKIQIDNCFTFVLPFELNTYREQDICNHIYNIKNPYGRVVVRLRKVNTNTIDEIPDVNLRNTREEYKRYEKVISRRTFYIFEKENAGYELSAFAFFEDNLLTVSLTSQVNRDLKKEFEVLLSSVEVLK